MITLRLAREIEDWCTRIEIFYDEDLLLRIGTNRGVRFNESKRTLELDKVKRVLTEVSWDNVKIRNWDGRTLQLSVKRRWQK